MKRFTKIMAIIMATALIMGIAAISASAGTTYTAATGGTTQFNKYLIIENGADVPNKTFTYTIAPGTAIPAGSGTMEVLAGLGSPTVDSATFTHSDTILTDTATGTFTGTANAKYAAKTGITVDFSSVSFPEPGVYRYTLTEATQTSPYSLVTNNNLTLDVYVTDNGTGTLGVVSYVLHTGTAAPTTGTNFGSGDVANAGDRVDDKTDKFVNSYATKDITVSKAVSGNQASKDKYFKFTVTVPNLTAADTFNVDISNADAAPTGNSATAYNNMTNPTEVTGTQLASGVDFYLQHGQSVKILGLPVGATYTVTEAPEDYKPALSCSDNTATITNTVTASGTLTNDITAAYTNTRDGIIPTGVLLTIAPFAIGILLFGALIIFIIAKRRRNNY